jgi:hypothetical protein
MLLAFVLLFSSCLFSSCGGRRVGLVLPQPGGSNYSPPSWVDLHPGMEFRIEGAYYREGSPRRNSTDYLGTETAAYEVRSNGTLRLGSVTSFLDQQPGKQQPRDQPAVQLLVRPRNLTWRYHRLFFQVVMSRTGAIRPAVLIGSRSIAELDSLTKRFLEGQYSVCDPGSDRCNSFPEWCTASLAIGIVVNGTARKVVWGSTLGTVTPHPRHVELLRVSNGKLATVRIDAADPEALRLPLVHGDQVNWN